MPMAPMRMAPIRIRFRGALAALAPLLVAASLGFAAPAVRPAGVPRAAVGLEIHDAIGPATALYVEHGLETAQQRGSPFVILQIDTPGGLATIGRAHV